MSKYFNTLWFFIGFATGMLYVYIAQPAQKIIMKHPTPDNASKVVYHDAQNNCYRYLAEEIKCPNDLTLAVNHPLVLSN
jgi:hypothetical protein